MLVGERDAEILLGDLAAGDRNIHDPTFRAGWPPAATRCR
jgi:hypothetical protein